MAVHLRVVGNGGVEIVLGLAHHASALGRRIESDVTAGWNAVDRIGAGQRVHDATWRRRLDDDGAVAAAAAVVTAGIVVVAGLGRTDQRGER